MSHRTLIIPVTGNSYRADRARNKQTKAWLFILTSSSYLKSYVRKKRLFYHHPITIY